MTIEEREIAETIRRQLMAGGVTIVWSWGPHNWTALPHTSESRGGLRFNVDGRTYQGVVNIRLMPNDTYNLEIGAVTYRDVYCDQLTSFVDECVETGE